MVVNHYDNTTSQWEQLHQNLLDGEKEQNTYWQAFVDELGIIHLSWVWRETWDASTNHNIAYAKSRDGGVTCERSNGTVYNPPITAKTAEHASRIAQKKV